MTNLEKEKILLKINLTRKDIQNLTGFNYANIRKIFDNMKESILNKIRKEDPDFKFYDDKYIPTIHALPLLKRYGIDKDIIEHNAKVEKDLY